MFFAKKLATSIVLPPGLLIILFIFIGLFAKRRLITIVSIASAILLYMLSIEPIKDIIYLSLENKAQSLTPLFHINEIKNLKWNANSALELYNIDAIVVLGGGVYENGNFKEDSANRLIAAYFLYSTLKKPLILSGGSADFRIKESYTMYSVLHHMNISQSNIIIENKSRDTHENAKFVSKICESKNYKHIALITSAYHLPRAYHYFKQTPLRIVSVFCDSKLDLRYDEYSFLPTFSNFANSSKGLRELVALLVVSFFDP